MCTPQHNDWFMARCAYDLCLGNGIGKVLHDTKDTPTSVGLFLLTEFIAEKA